VPVAKIHKCLQVSTHSPYHDRIYIHMYIIISNHSGFEGWYITFYANDLVLQLVDGEQRQCRLRAVSSVAAPRDAERQQQLGIVGRVEWKDEPLHAEIVCGYRPSLHRSFGGSATRRECSPAGLRIDYLVTTHS
jgi:hypothetical protein